VDDLAVAALITDSQKTFLKIEVSGAWLLPLIVKGTFNPWWGMGVSNACGASKYIGGQFRDNMLGFRLPNSTGRVLL
jgi:hypothetical protein